MGRKPLLRPAVKPLVRRILPQDTKPVFNERQAAFLVHLATCLVPEVADFDARGRKRMRLIIRAALNKRSPFERLQVKLFLGVIQWAPALIYFRPFERIPPSAQTAILHWLEGAPIKLVRVGFWGLKTVILMGIYGQEPIARAIGYEPSFAGNDLLS